MINEALRDAEEKRLKDLRERRERKQAWVDQLLNEASLLQQAKTIREYIVDARVANASLGEPVPLDEFDAWAEWASQQADRIDPIKTGAFSQINETIVGRTKVGDDNGV